MGRGFFGLVANGFARFVGIKKDILMVAGGRLYLDITGLLKIVRLAWCLRSLVGGVALAWVRPAYARRRALARAERYISEVKQAFQKAVSLDARLIVLDQYASTMLPQLIRTGLLPTGFVGIIAQFITDRWLVAWAGVEPRSVRRLLRGLPGNPTAEMDLTLWATAQAIRNDAAANAIFHSQGAAEIANAFQQRSLPPAAQQAIQAFLDQYGMRAVREIDLGIPRWREDPGALISNLGSYLQIGEPDLAPDRLFQRTGAEAERLSEEYITQVRQKKGWLHARLLRIVIGRMRLLNGFREMPKFYIVKLLDQMRTAMLDSGRQLAAQGKLDCAEDIFFIPLDTLRQAAHGQPQNFKSTVRQARDDYDRELSRRRIPQLLLSTGEAFYQGVGSGGENDLVGDGVSPGTVEGKVRVVQDPRGVRLQPGEILVCPATDPGWTPLFLSAGGLIMELGGMMTHGSVVAREYGIPAVVGIYEATKRLHTGQRVRVDGSLGHVVILENDAT